MEPWSSESVPRALLPVLIHEMNNGTQLLVGFRSLLDIPGGEALFGQKAGELADGSRKLEDLGFAEAAGRVEKAVAASIAQGKTTPDLGGGLSTEEAGAWIAEQAVQGAGSPN